MEAGTRLGPYEVVAPLGAGGMGEVYRARDTRLGRDVAIKVLPAAFASDPDRVSRFEKEARTVASLSHSNILALYDVGTHEGHRYLVTELLEGQTLEQRLRGGAVPASTAVDIAIHVARGLAAAHEKGIVHRDIKPSNIFITTDGTAKILDFGIARLARAEAREALGTTSTAVGSLLGSVAYMSPEQVRGVPADHRSDLFALGAVLYEMLGGERPFRGAGHGEVTAAILRDDPAPLPGALPPVLARIVLRCLEKRPDDRFGSARDLGFALQAVADTVPRAAVRAAEPPRPYPGLSVFTEADAGRFFGREEEVAALWRVLPGRRLLALIGPSGAGKSSFVRAGLVPHAPPGWRCLVAAPGRAPSAALARVLAPTLAGDAEAVRQLVDFADPATALGLVARWRQDADHGLVVVDQLEELFTLNGEEVQASFAELLGKIASLDGLHVLLVMRDDFFFACHRLPALAEVFREVTPLGPPSSVGMRSALVEPARALGFTFDDAALVDEMVQAVEGERGALPLLAFAAAAMWERRDQEAKKLTRAAYDAIGGVAGALALHAEATLDAVGTDRQPLVREVFRNLTTSHHTRLVLDIGELLSVFPAPQRGDAREVLARLVDARLLTAYDEEGPDGSRRQRVEIVHESLLAAWSRLVRWRTEDESSSQLRDQLRQAAHLWEEKGRPDDLLWTGTVYREFALWRERYPGGLSEVEEAFGRAMVTRAERRRQMRRLAVAAVIGVLAGVLTVVGTSLRRTRLALVRTDASRLVALGRAISVEADPTSALAYAIASLERADSTEARMLALDAMAHGPVAFIADSHGSPTSPSFSRDGNWLVVPPVPPDPEVRLWSRDGRASRIKAEMQFIGAQAGFVQGAEAIWTFDRHGERHLDTTLTAWSLPEGGKLVEAADRLPLWFADLREPGRLAILKLLDGRAELREVPVDPPGTQVLHTYTLPELAGGWPRFTRSVAGKEIVAGATPAVDPLGRWFAFPAGRDIIVQPFGAGAPARRLASHDSAVMAVVPSQDGEVVGGRDVSGGIRLWTVTTGEQVARLECDDSDRTFEISGDGRSVLARGGLVHAETGPTAGSLLVWRLGSGSQRPGREISLPDSFWSHATDPAMRWVGVATNTRHSEIWDLSSLSGARPLALRQGIELAGVYLAFDPSGVWAATVSPSVSLWPLRRDYPRVVTGFSKGINAVAFSRDGETLARLAKDSSSDMRLWPLTGDPPAPSRRVITARDNMSFLIDAEETPDGSLWAVSSYAGLALVPNSGGALRRLEGFSMPGILGVAVSPDGSLVAGGGRWPQEAAIRVWEVRSGRGIAVLDAGDRAPILALAFLSDGRLAAGALTGVRIWDPAGKTSRVLWTPPTVVPDRAVQFVRSAAAGQLVFSYGSEMVANDEAGHAFAADVATGSVRRLDSHGGRVYAVAIDRTGTIVATGSGDGIVRVGPASGGMPHLLIGHTNRVTSVAISPAGDWIASGSDDTTVRLWPMPDLSKPPAHTVPLPDLLARLKSQTNVRVVADPAAPGGYRTEPGPFPGWAVVPEWQP